MADEDFKNFLSDKFLSLEKKFDESMKDLKSDFREQQKTMVQLQLAHSNLSQDFTNAQNSNRAEHARYEKNIESLCEIVLKSDPMATSKTVRDHEDRFNEVAGAVKSMKVFGFLGGMIISIFVAIVGWLQYLSLTRGN